MTTVEINQKRLQHQMSLYGLTQDDLLSKLNEGKQKIKFTATDVFVDNIDARILQRIDKLFGKGLSYYVDPSEPTRRKEESIFFRKNEFNGVLNFAAKQLVNKYEEEKIAFSSIAKQTDLRLRRILKVYSIKDNPRTVANEIRKGDFPNYNSDDRKALKELTNWLGNFNVLVLEFADHPKTKDKPNIEGLFIAPNVIVLKRHKYARRQLFTLAHELGHYLLNEEEVDESVGGDRSNTNDVETWCNEFAFFLLIGGYYELIDGLSNATAENDYHKYLVEKIQSYTNLSELAIYTRLLWEKKVSWPYYLKIKEDILNRIKATEENDKARYEAEKQKTLAAGKEYIVPTPPPIRSSLYVNVLKGALSSGLISEIDFCIKLRLNPNKLDAYLAA